MNSDSMIPAIRAALHWRYATKVFDPHRRIPDETWTLLEDALVLSPSSFGLQPYRFIVVKDPATRAAMVSHAWNQKQIVEASHLVVFAARTGVTEAEIDKFLAHTATVRSMKVDALAGYRAMMTGMLLSEPFKPQAIHWAAHQAYIALGNLLTTAALLHVDACPIEGFAPAEFDQILGLTPQGLTAVVCAALGYRHPSDKHSSLVKVRFPKSDLIQTV